MEVQKKAEELAQAIIDSPEYKRLLEARTRVNSHQAARLMLRDFQQKQLELHRNRWKGRS